jgi:hypothetical protein
MNHVRGPVAAGKTRQFVNNQRIVAPTAGNVVKQKVAKMGTNHRLLLCQNGILTLPNKDAKCSYGPVAVEMEIASKGRRNYGENRKGGKT